MKEGREKYLLDYFYKHICEFQIKAINNQTIVNDLDKKISNKYLKIKLSRNSVPNDTDAKELAALLDKQINIVSDYVYEICNSSYDAINEYFDDLGRAGSCLPRVCVKSIVGDRVEDLFRINEEDEEYNTPLELKKNSAFENIFKHKRITHVHVEDIPKAALKAKSPYTNTRLDMAKVARYYTQREEKLGFNERAETISDEDDENTYYDEEWSKCFLSVGTKGTRAYYKSTFVFAVLLDGVTHSLDSECKRILKSSASRSNRFVFGYLCFDHLLENYFVEEDILPLGSIFADLISMPMALQSACIHNSEVFSNAYEYLNDDYGDLIEQYPNTLKLISKSINNAGLKKTNKSKKKSSTKKGVTSKKKSATKVKDEKMEPITILKSIAATLGIVDKATDMIKKHAGKKLTEHRVKTVLDGEFIEIHNNGKVDYKIHMSELHMEKWDEKRYKTLEGKIDDHWGQYNDIDGELPAASVDEKARLKIKMNKIRKDLCEDFRELMALHEATLGVALGDHYSLFEICSD